MSTLYVIENYIGLKEFLTIGMVTLVAVIIFNKKFKNEDKR